MAQLLRRIDDEVYVEYGTFGLDGTDLEAWQSPEGYHFAAAVRLESWDREPELPDAPWTPVKTDSFVAESGVVHLMTMMDGRGHDFLIGPPLFEYGVAMYFQVCQPGDDHGEDDYGEDGCEAEELTRGRSRSFSMPVEGRGADYLSPGITRRLWRWEDDILGGESQDGGLTVDRQILAKNPVTRQIFVSGIVTILRRDHDRSSYGGLNWYVVRDAEPHEAARVLCAEATWEEGPERRRALDELAREEAEKMRAARRNPAS